MHPSHNLTDIWHFIKHRRYLLLVSMVIILVVSTFTVVVAHTSQQKTMKLHHDIKEQGVLVMAYSYKDDCRSRHKARYYRFSVDKKDYFKVADPDDSTIIVCQSPLGDGIAVYYIKDKPYRNLTQQQLQMGVKSVWEYTFIGVFSAVVFLSYSLWKIISSYYTMDKQNILPSKPSQKEHS